MPLVVLVATDFSDASDRALAEALRWARQAGGRLVIAHVLPSRLVAENEQTRLREEEAWMLLDRLRGEAENNGVPAEIQLRHGAVAAQLLDLIDSLAVDLVVLGPRGRGWVTRAVFGSVSRRICEQSRAPVLLVRDSTPPESRAEEGL